MEPSGKSVTWSRKRWRGPGLAKLLRVDHGVKNPGQVPATGDVHGSCRPGLVPFRLLIMTCSDMFKVPQPVQQARVVGGIVKSAAVMQYIVTDQAPAWLQGQTVNERVL